jgi:molybdopterin synthase sulfur carrier subunit
MLPTLLFCSVVKIVLTANLQKYYPEREFELEAKSVREILERMDARRPLFSTYILEDDGAVRRHVNLFLNGQLLPKDKVQTAVKSGDTVHIMQALSGG